MTAVFINYRVSDTGPLANCLSRELARAFGEHEVYFASRNIAVGDFFDEDILAHLRVCRVVVVLIGTQWMSAQDAGGRRLDDEQDWVRREIAEALSRGTRVVPVLVGDARMPLAGDLPQDIRDLARCNYVRLGHRHGDPDVDALVQRLREAEPQLPRPARQGVSPVPGTAAAPGHFPGTTATTSAPASANQPRTTATPGLRTPIPRARVLATTTATTLLTALLIAGGTREVEVATDLVVPLAVLALLATVFGVRLGPRERGREALWAACRMLADRVAEREGAEQNRLLAETGRAQQADVGFTRYTPDEDMVYWRGDGGASRGSSAKIAGFYASLGQGRLVVLGAAGAGKTVLVNRLLLDVIAGLPREDPGAGEDVRVPVRLSLPAFDPGHNVADLQAGILAKRLDEWIAGRLREVFGVQSRIARRLVAEGWILPVLDGLDEMDPDGQAPVRATALARALNHQVGTGLRPVVLACRESRYRQLAGERSGPGRLNVLQDATAVHLEPLTVAQVHGYLTYRFPDPAHPERIQERWQPVLAHIHTAHGEPLAAALRSPLGLFLIITIYHDFKTHPREMIGRSAADLDEALFGQLVHAVTQQHPRPDGSHYADADVARWLGTLADHLRAQQSRGGSASDLDLHLLWPAAGPRAPRYIQPVFYLVAEPIFMVATVQATGRPVLYQGSLVQLLVLMVVLSALLSLQIRVSAAQRRVGRLDLNLLRSRASRRRLIAGCWVAFAAGFVPTVFNLTYAHKARFEHKLLDNSIDIYISSLTRGIEFLFVALLVFGIYLGAARPFSAIAKPSELVARGWTYDFVTQIGSVLLVGFASGFIFAFGLVPRSSFVLGFVFGFLSMSGFRSLGSPWLRYLTAVRLLAHNGRLPPRPALFLDWACVAGLMRLSGISVQFRHRRLQEHLQTTMTATPAAEPAETPHAS
jgi:hypothetical protein